MSFLSAVAFGASAGALLGYAWSQAGWRKRIGEASDLARALEHGKLGQTLPERGPLAFRILARSLNGVSANFQEILLLFAHHVRHLKASVEAEAGRGALARGASRRQDLLDELFEMDQVLHDFDYYRVRLEDDSITDTGPVREQRPAETAVPSGLAASSPSRAVGGSNDE